MLQINKVVIAGNLTQDPELKQLQNGTVCNFSIANNQSYKGKESVSFFNVQAWAGVGQNVAKYCKKGSPVVVCGSIHQENWTDRDGNKRTGFKINANEVHFAGGRKDDDDANTGAESEGGGGSDDDPISN